MLKKTSLSAVLVVLAMGGSSFAQTIAMPDNAPAPWIEIPRETAQAPLTDFTVVFDTSHAQTAGGRPTPALLMGIMRWLSAGFDLPASQEIPAVEFLPPVKLVALRYRGVLPQNWREDSILDQSVLAAHPRQIVALYGDKTKTNYLPETWIGATPGDISIVVHELVHHLQNVGAIKYECPAAREKLAYQAQGEWLKQHGLNLEKEFDVDMLTLLVSSACMN